MQGDQRSNEPEQSTKTCSSCGVSKPGSEFSKDRTKRDGLYHLCKDCRSAYRLQKKNARKNSSKTSEPTSKETDRESEDVGVLAIVHSGVECGVCSVCGVSLMGYVPGYLRGQPICKGCVIQNMKALFEKKKTTS